MVCLASGRQLLSPHLPFSTDPWHFNAKILLIVLHLLVERPSLGNFRRRYFSEYRVGDGSFSLSLVLGEVACGVGEGNLSFVEEAGLHAKQAEPLISPGAIATTTL